MRIATFNVENLFTRFLFNRGVDRRKAHQHGFTSEDLRFRVADPQSKRLTAEVVQALDADVLALQEVESLEVLKRFRDRMLGGRESYPFAAVLDGNDDRRIDVGVLSRLPIVHLRSWQHLWTEGRPVFDRDCLEVDVLGERTITLYINHFKSMRSDGSRRPREATAPRRRQQARAVRDIVEQRFGPDGDGDFVVLGDFNDRRTPDEEGPTSLQPLLDWDALVDICAGLDEADRWTHYYRGRRGSAGRYQQLDYLLLSRSLARCAGAPHLERRGMPGRAERYAGERFEGVGFDRPKASDHCALAVDLDL